MFESLNIVGCIEASLPEDAGNFSEHGLCIIDIDCDGVPEICIATIRGLILFYKLIDDHIQLAYIGRLEQVQNPPDERSLNTLGPITCITRGDVLNDGSECLVAISAEGLCHIFQPQKQSDRMIFPSFSISIPNNAISLAIGDADNDGMNELIIGLHNCALHAFRLSKRSVSDESKDGDAASTDALNVQPVLARNPDVEGDNGTAQTNWNSWPAVVLPAQTWSVSVLRGLEQKHNCLAINMGFLTLLFDPNSQTLKNVSEGSLMGEDHEKIVHSCFVFRRAGFDHDLLMLYSADGKVRVLNSVDTSRVIWSCDLENTLMFASDLTVRGHHYLILCAWEGSTFLIDSCWKVYRFSLGETVLGFEPTIFQHEDGTSEVCFVYVTGDSQLRVMKDVRIPTPGRPRNFQAFLAKRKLGSA
jgi:hypothetical protein